MYYITNQNHQIIAIDPTLLRVLEVDDIHQLYQRIALTEISFSPLTPQEPQLTIQTPQKAHHYESQIIPITSLLGELQLITLTPTTSTTLESNEVPLEALAKSEESLEEPLESLDDTSAFDMSLLDEDLLAEEPSSEATPLLEPEEKEAEEEEESLSLESTPEIALEESITLEEPTQEPAVTPPAKEEIQEELELDLDTIFEEASEADPLSLEEPETPQESSDDLLLFEEEETPQVAEEAEELLTQAPAPAPAPAPQEPVEELLDDEILDLGLSDADIDHSLNIGSSVEPETPEPKAELFDLDLDLDTPTTPEPSPEPLTEPTPPQEDLFDLELNLEPTPSVEESLSEPEAEPALELGLDSTPEASSPKAEEPKEEEHLELLLPNESDTIIEKIEPQEEDPLLTSAHETTPILIDIDKVSEEIGISHEDYNTFLNEYIDTALTLEEDLRGALETPCSEAVNTLSHLSNVLQLPLVTEIVTTIGEQTPPQKSAYVDAFYATLGRLTTAVPATPTTPSVALDLEPATLTQAVEESLHEVAVAPAPTPEPTPDPVAPVTEIIEEVTPEPEVEEPQGFGTLNLDDVKSIHFDFQMEQAANDLSLPVELIEEFVGDFIGQAHEETQKMLDAYERGDLDTIQKIGHLLKGTSSNLRIDPLADTLYEIQFCEDSSRLEGLIKNYWAHFLSLEAQVNLISN